LGILDGRFAVKFGNPPVCITDPSGLFVQSIVLADARSRIWLFRNLI